MMLFTALNIPSNNNHRNTDKYTLYPNNISFHNSPKKLFTKTEKHIFRKRHIVFMTEQQELNVCFRSYDCEELKTGKANQDPAQYSELKLIWLPLRQWGPEKGNLLRGQRGPERGRIQPLPPQPQPHNHHCIALLQSYSTIIQHTTLEKCPDKPKHNLAVPKLSKILSVASPKKIIYI